MEKYMSVGELAREAGVSVRTVQFYDKSGLLKPASHSEGGNRLYTSKELVILHQIKGLKELGLSLTEIKERMVSLDEPSAVLRILEGQKETIAANIQNLQDTLYALEILESEIKHSNSIDFTAYAKVLSSVKENRDSLWAFKNMKPDLRAHVINKFGVLGSDNINFYQRMMNIFDKIIQAQSEDITPNSPKGRKLLESFASMIHEFLDGDMSLLFSLQDFERKIEFDTSEFAKKWQQVAPFIHDAQQIQGIYDEGIDLLKGDSHD
ncbi:MAG: MerR family transcriptional regulator [Defluviitaleaceae bacterium]|nr:MerR family transcriptional regulator [Defluviitaleaceae bacterium]